MYDAFILDQFGVLHNGVEALDGAVEAVTHLHEKRKKLIILSNTSAPAHMALAKLPRLGFAAHHFGGGAVTSGEEASRYVRQRYGGPDRKTATKALFWTWDAQKPDNPRLTAPPQAFLDRCGNVEVAADVEDADLILLHGSEVWHRGPDAPQQPLGSFIEDGDCSAIVDPLLRRCLARDLPMVCANPDLVVLTPAGGTAHMPGRIARRYRELGATDRQCRVFGKPDAEHFEACLRRLGMEHKRTRVAHVGDSLSHDVAGAAAAGIPAVFVASGIHARQLGIPFGAAPEPEALRRLLAEEGSAPPTHVVPAFRL